MSESLSALTEMIRETLGEDAPPDLQIRPETSFSEDLELESIEFVALAEKVQARYGERVDFVAWLSRKDLDEIVRLQVGELAEYIDQCLSSTPED